LVPANSVTSASESGDPGGWGYTVAATNSIWIQGWFKYKSNFDFHGVANKLIYLKNANGSPVFVIDGPTPSAGQNHVRAWVGAPFGSRALFPNLVTTTITAGVWYKLKLHIDTSTGLFEYWVNAVKNASYADVVIASQITEVNCTPVWGGVGQTGPSVDDYVYYDDFFISNDTDPGGGAAVVGPGAVVDLVAAAVDSASVSLTFTEVDDGTGKPASYDVRYSASPISWGLAPGVVHGTCAVPVAGTAIGARRTCGVAGLAPSTAYDFQLVAFRGVLNSGATFGGLSNVATATTLGPRADAGSSDAATADAATADAATADAALDAATADASPSPGRIHGSCDGCSSGGDGVPPLFVAVAAVLGVSALRRRRARAEHKCEPRAYLKNGRDPDS
jgi:uncharacterized protein (TIGR03382 family)